MRTEQLERLRKLAKDYDKIKRKRPIEYHERGTAPIMDPETAFEWPRGLDAGYCVMRKRKIGNRMIDVVIHVAVDQESAVKWAITDAEKD